MTSRISQTIVLCEDKAHKGLTKSFLKQCGLPSDSPRVKWLVASDEGGNDSWVLNRFADELHACRQRNKHAKTLLIVLIDADRKSVEDRRRQMFERVKSAGYEPFDENEPAILFIPKRHVETWLRVLLGETVNEEDDCKGWSKPGKNVFRPAAQTLYDWSRPNAEPGPTCVESLEKALPDWKDRLI